MTTAAGFKSVEIFRGESLGFGAYGEVCKAKCDDLICAAKLLHPTLLGGHSTSIATAEVGGHSMTWVVVRVRELQRELQNLSSAANL